MAADFDAYYKWLGIPPKDQPPNHYRLLAIELFESDAEVIDAAANRQMAYLQEFVAGPHVVESQRLLNEVAAARVCLLNPDAKARYDAGLRSRSVAPPVAAAKLKVARPLPETPQESIPIPPVAAFPAADVGAREETPGIVVDAAAHGRAAKGARRAMDSSHNLRLRRSELPAFENLDPASATQVDPFAAPTVGPAPVPFIAPPPANRPASAGRPATRRSRSNLNLGLQIASAIAFCLIIAVLILKFGGRSATNSVPTVSTPTVSRPAPPITPAKPSDSVRQTPSTVNVPRSPSRLVLPAGASQVVLPVRFGGNLLFATVELDGQTLQNVILDTGAAAMMIDMQIADSLQLPELRPGELTGYVGQQAVSLRRAQSLNLAGATLAEPTVAAVDLEPWKQQLGIPISGVVGFEVWSQLPFTLDYVANRVTFHARDAFSPPASAIAERLTIRDSQPWVEGRINGIFAGKLLLSTGTPNGLVLHPEFVDRLRANGLRDGGGPIELVGLEGIASAEQLKLTKLSLLGLDVPNLKALAPQTSESPVLALSDTIGYVGGAVLKRGRLTCDFQTGQVWLVPAAAPPLAPTDFLKLSPLIAAAIEGDFNLLTETLAASPNLDARDPQGNSALAIVAARGYADLTDALLRAKANIDAVNDQGETPLMLAVQSGSLEAVLSLLRSRPKSNLQTPGGLFPLLIAVRRGQIDICKALVEHGVNVNATNKQGLTALMVAAWQGNDEIVKLLLANKANPKLRNARGADAKTIAVLHNHPEIADLLTTAMAAAPGNEPPRRATPDHRIEDEFSVTLPRAIVGATRLE